MFFRAPLNILRTESGEKIFRQPALRALNKIPHA